MTTENTNGGVPEDWTSVGEASKATGLPSRTIYRWIRSGTLRSREDGKNKLILLADVRRLAAERGDGAPLGTMTPALPGIAAGAPARSANGAPPLQIDGDMAARLFERFDGGDAPVDVVRTERLLPHVVQGVYDAWRRLRDLGGKGEPKAVDALKTVTKDAASARALLDEINDGLAREFGGQASWRKEQDARMEDLASRLQLLQSGHAHVAQAVLTITSDAHRVALAVGPIEDLLRKLRFEVQAVNDELRRTRR